MNQYDIYIKDPGAVVDVVVSGLANKIALLPYPSSLILSSTDGVKMTRTSYFGDIENRLFLDVELINGMDVEKFISASNELLLSSEANVVRELHVGMEDSGFILASLVSAHIARLRTLSDMDPFVLSDFDNSTLDDLEHITI